MIRVVMISPLPPQRTGESTYAARLIRLLAETGKVSIVAIAGEDASPVSSRSAAIDTIRIWRGRDLRYPFVLLQHLRTLRPHLIHIQFGPDGRIYGGLFGEPMLVLLLLLRLVGLKTTVTLHSTWMTEQVIERVSRYKRLGRISFLAGAFFKMYMRLLEWGTDTVQLSTVKMDSTLRRRFLREYGYKQDRVLEIPHPCDQPKSRPRLETAQELLDLSGKKVIVLFGFIRRGKGLDVALKAIDVLRHSVPDVVLLIAGTPLDNDDANYLQELRNLSERLSLGHHVRFESRFIPDEEVPVLFSAASVILIPYVENVGASGPVHNYAGYGVPIVASDVGCHLKEALGGSLTLFRSGNPEDLAAKLVRVLKDKDLAERIRQKQMEYAKRETWEVAVRRTLQNYRKTLMHDEQDV